MSAPQILWRLERLQRRRIQREVRTLAISAAGHSGEAAEKLMERFLDELEELGGGPEKTEAREPVSRTPRSQAEFEAMLKHG
jgi:hypothetical protein